MAQTPSPLSVSIETITPAAAADMLAANIPNNRAIKPKKVAQYAREMQSGIWKHTGDPIRISDRGYTIDGQHRLSAITRTGETMELVVVRNVPHESFVALDQGPTRTVADILHTQGYKNPTKLQTTINEVLQYERYLSDKFRNGEPVTRRESHRPYTAGSGGIDTTRNDRLEVLTRRPDLPDSVRLAMPFTRVKASTVVSVKVGMAALLIDIASAIGEADYAVEFLTEVTTIQSAHPHVAGTNPALLMGGALVRHRSGSPTYTLSQTQIRAMLFRAYQAWRMNENLQRLPRPRTAFPAVAGDVEWYWAGKGE